MITVAQSFIRPLRTASRNQQGGRKTLEHSCTSDSSEDGELLWQWLYSSLSVSEVTEPTRTKKY
ncbi:uncharacterized protein M6B38_386985 [Iris pallida]|uniref:Uncharacterized protein n=1 Tax=Iris pallida TaxID=29817 RepID=A0AAX6G274_IRIPA|nr:uncharacterized protein M6B38_386985 [Iris pallida]